ncbi:hypothetical protein HDF15_002742 [Granulicella mallensis]|uniref:Uncharacterized protein n=1 Tax=Granulicella mallensis TaxID=940614 RepID=A0A7W7ZQT2_9BACT|nr:hypothetical protein [Granulicella mallensis]
MRSLQGPGPPPLSASLRRPFVGPLAWQAFGLGCTRPWSPSPSHSSLSEDRGALSRQLSTQPLPATPMSIGFCGRNRRFSSLLSC